LRRTSWCFFKSFASHPYTEEQEGYKYEIHRSDGFREKLTKAHVRAIIKAFHETADEMVAAYGDIDKALFFACQKDGVLGIVIDRSHH